MSILDRLFRRRHAKSADLPFFPAWGPRVIPWGEPSFERMATEGYRANSCVNQCVFRLAIGYTQPRPVVMVRDEPRETHPLQALLARPNPLMSFAELMNLVIHYKAIGGNVFLHKVRNKAGGVAELWPYHIGQVAPVASRFGWVEEYEYNIGDGEKRRVPAADIIHLKWPSVDLERPWLGLAPLLGVAREVDSDTEMTRYLLALLMTDAAPRGVITLPEGVAMSPTKAAQLRAQWEERHGGLNRGRIGILEQGASYERVSLNMQELAWEALRRIPESRIAGAFGVPAILAGLYVGLEKATYANFKEAREQLTQDTYMPLWESDSQELTQALSTEYSDSPAIEYDYAKVAALQENEDALYARVLLAFERNAVTKNEAREKLGLGPVGDINVQDIGDTFADGSRPDTDTDEPEPAPQPMIIDVTPQPPQLVDEQAQPVEELPKARYPFPATFKAAQRAATEDVEAEMEREFADYLKGQYEAAMQEVG